MVTSKLDTYWDEFFEQFIRTLVADGYDEFEILDKIMTVFKEIRAKNFIEKSNASSVEKDVIPVLSLEKNLLDEQVKPRKKRKYPEQHKNPDRHLNPHNYDKTLSSKFLHAYVYVTGKKDESLATIEYGPSQKVRDVYKLVSTGEELNEVQYLKRFNTAEEETPRGYGYLNRHVIVFEENPSVSIGLVKHKNNYQKFSSIEDVRRFKKYHTHK